MKLNYKATTTTTKRLSCQMQPTHNTQEQQQKYWKRWDSSFSSRMKMKMENNNNNNNKVNERRE